MMANMTLTDTVHTSANSAPFGSEMPLITDLASGTKYALAFGGQGSDWLEPLSEIVRNFGLERELVDIVTRSNEQLAPLRAETAHIPSDFDVLTWVDGLAAGESAEILDAPTPVTKDHLTKPVHSVPGILLTQLLGLAALERQGLDIRVHRPVAVIGHSQGSIAAQAIHGIDPAELLTIARLIGLAAQQVGARKGLLGRTMIAVSGVDPVRVADIIEPSGALARLRNGRRATVITGTQTHIAHAERLLGETTKQESERLKRKETGGAGFNPVIDEVNASLAFHHPDLAEARELVREWAAKLGLNAEHAAEIAHRAIIEPVDWVDSVQQTVEAGAEWVLDLGPADGASRLSMAELRPHGIGLVATTTRAGHRQLTSAGAKPERSTPWLAYAPNAVFLPDGTQRVETAFTRLTGKSPILLAGMTPTTVDAPIVAAAANAGFWAELAGGGQVTEQIFTARMTELRTLLDPGASFQFNALLLDPYLWKLQLGQNKLVQKARIAGAPIDGVIVTAGVPESDEAIALAEELEEAGITHLVFKPGTVKQIRQVLEIADKLDETRPGTSLIVQIEGGKAGGHHSWEDLDELLIASYAELRSRSNVVVCVGGGIGTPEIAAEYLTGRWAEAHGYPHMPLDGVLIGTAAMATLEATTSPQVKDLLVATEGTSQWLGAGRASGDMASGRSQLGADLHEIDNAFSRTGRLLDEVAGDSEAVTARRSEIIDALNATAKPYFGEVRSMTYAQLLERYLELSGQGLNAQATWLDVSWLERFHALVQRTEARLSHVDRGTIETRFPTVDSVHDGPRVLADLREMFADIDDVTLHPADAIYFLEVCRRPGKPVNFVPVIDADVRRWWRSDSLWQAHDPRYDADQVCVIPGPASVAGITRANEPVAELLQRFEDACLDTILANGVSALRVPGRRRVQRAESAVALVLAASDVHWAGRMVQNPVLKLGGTWILVEPAQAEHAATGATLRTTDTGARFTVPLDEQRHVSIDFAVGGKVALGHAPVVTDADAIAATNSIVRGAIAGELPEVTGGVARVTVAWPQSLPADHAAVTFDEPNTDASIAPDVFLGLAWPSIFAVLSEAVSNNGVRIVEGMLDLVHLDHQVKLTSVTQPAGADLEIEARLDEVTDTPAGRVVTIEVCVGDTVQLTERLLILGRTGTETLTDPAPAAGTGTDAKATPRRERANYTSHAPVDMRAFAAVTGDHNPIHTSNAAALLAGLGEPIVHGMWTSAHAQRVLSAQTGRRVTAWTARFMAPVALGAALEVKASRVGLLPCSERNSAAGAELVEVTVMADGALAMSATARLEAPCTAYAFPGQGIQKQGMGMDGYQRSVAAREVWDRADAHTRSALGFSILTVVRDNPTELIAHGVTHKHPDGVLYLTQFTQVAMAVLGAAQIAELREADAYVEGAIIAGHSVGEYNALAAVSGVISLEAVVEVVFQRGSVMHTLVPRDEHGRSNYRLAAIRPSQIGLADADVERYLADIADASGEFLQVVNFNQLGNQYAIAGTVRGLEELERDIAKRRAEFGGKAAFILVPGVDVPFHSKVLQSGVPAFRTRLEELLPESIDPAILAGRYVPNLVPKPFSLEREFIEEIADLVDSAPLNEVLSQFDVWAAKPERLCRTVLIELLAWQFASPVRWIETQDLMFTPESAGGLGVQRFIEVGIGTAPTVANLASGTLKARNIEGIEVLNIERDAGIVFATDEDIVVEDLADDVAEAPQDGGEEIAAAQDAPSPAQPASAPQAHVPDLDFTAADATRVLIAWWTKMRPDQLGAADSIESLCDGASSRRNQLLVDLGAELSLGAIDGAAEADMVTLASKTSAMARGYRPFGSVLSGTISDHLAKVLGPSGKRPAFIGERVRDVWQLGDGWVPHVTAHLAMATREGTSVRGGDFGPSASLAKADDVANAIDTAISEVALAQGLTVTMPQASSGEGATIDVAALAEFTSAITGADGVLASAANLVLDHLGLRTHAAAIETDADALALREHIERELGADWVRHTATAFDADLAFVLDDRWASAREDVARIGLGLEVPDSLQFAGTGESVARQAEYWFTKNPDPRLGEIAKAARREASGPFSEDVAVVTGASTGSIAAGVVANLLRQGATVVATTSSMSDSKREFFKKLYRSNAAGGAVLWVVPANMASFADVDALAEWLRTEQSHTAAGVTTVMKPALVPSLLVPFAAGSASGETVDAGPQTETQARILLWSVERLMGQIAEHITARDINASLHVLLPGSPNRGMFGGDGAYAEAKAGLDALVNKWRSEKRWAKRITLTHAIIGWVRGTGLMSRNDPLVEAVEAAGVQTWAPDDMAAALLDHCTPAKRLAAASDPIEVDLTGGLGEIELDLAALAALAAEATESLQTERNADTAHDSTTTIGALPAPPSRMPALVSPQWGEVSARVEDMVVIVGAGELGPLGSSRTRYEMEVHDELSAAGVLELAWLTGLVTFDDAQGSWMDTETGEPVPEAELADRYEDEVRQRIGIRQYEDDGDMVENSAPLLTSVYLDKDLTFSVSSQAEAEAMRAADPENTRASVNNEGEWTVTRAAGTEIRVPRAMKLSRTVGGQIPSGFDPTRWGISPEMVQSIDRVSLWNLVCTVDAFLSSGFTPAELLRWVHPSRVANTQGTGMGGMTSMRSLYIDTLLGNPTPNDILQEALPNVIAAHVVQSYVGGYGAMVHPVAACATTAVSIEEAVDKIAVDKADFVVAGGFDDLGIEGIVGFGDMAATADSARMAAKGIAPRHFSRANDRRYGGFVESQGGGTILLARGDVALELGLPVLGVLAYAASFADGIHTSIPAPGLGALAAGLDGKESRLARALAKLGVSADDIAVVSKHDTSTGVNERNESELHERLASAIGREPSNPMFVISQKTLTGHAKGGAAAFQVIGLCQVLAEGILPPNRSLDCVMDDLAEHERLVWLREPLASGPLKAGLVTSLGFGHVAGLIAIVHPQAFIAALPEARKASYLAGAQERKRAGRARLTDAMFGGEPAYQRAQDRRLGDRNVRDLEANVLLDSQARLCPDGIYSCQ